MNHRKSILNYIFFLTLLILFSSFTVGCLSDENKTLELDSNNSIKTDVSKVIDHQYDESKQPMKAEFIDSKINDLLQAQAKLIVPEIEKAFPKPIPIDYSRLENAFAKLLLDSRSKENLRKYQFICDENERWIYRCNMDSGEIECFSMSSNKLRLLSSIK